MAIIFKYKLQKRADGVEAKLPHIPIEIKGNGSGWIQTMALVDSGADVSVVPRDLAELIGLDLSGKETIANGIGGQVRTLKTKMKSDVLPTLKACPSDESFAIAKEWGFT